jgi:hypothetical protein
VLRRAVELGVTHVDTSQAYGPDVANELIRRTLHPYPPELLVATKVGVVRDERRAFAAAGRPEELGDQVEANLRTLGVDRPAWCTSPSSTRWWRNRPDPVVRWRHASKSVLLATGSQAVSSARASSRLTERPQCPPRPAPPQRLPGPNPTTRR